MQGVMGASKGATTHVLGSLSSFGGLCAGFRVTAARWQGSRVSAVMNRGCGQTRGGPSGGPCLCQQFFWVDLRRRRYGSHTTNA